LLSSSGEALRWWNGKRGDGLATNIPWEELFIFSLYQMAQSFRSPPQVDARVVARSGKERGHGKA
jgi:hypothetical protein